MYRRSVTLDLIRIISALWVVSFHWSGRGGFFASLTTKWDTGWWPDFLEPISSTGYLGVDVFFILSGAVIAKSSLGATSKAFFYSRFFRLFPTYLIALCLTIIISPYKSHSFNFSPTQYILNFAFLPLIIPNLPIVIGVTWTLRFELIFYTSVYMAIKFSNYQKGRFNSDSLFQFLRFFILIICLCEIIGYGNSFMNDLVGFSAYFALGACVSQITGMRDFKRFTFHILPAIIFSGMMFYSRVPEMENKLIFTAFLLTMTVFAIFASQLESTPLRESRFRKAIKTASLMTYPVYLLHESAGMSSIALLYRYGLSIQRCYQVVFVILMIVSWSLVTYYEPGFRKFFRKISAF